MSLQSIENWCLYYAMKGNADMLKLYRCVNKLNENIKKQAQLDAEKTKDEGLSI